MIIYKATNEVNGKNYIGQTVHNLNHRKKGHLGDIKRHDNGNNYFHNAIRKYGEDNFHWEVIEDCDTKEELDEMEFHYIKQYDTFKPNGYNLTLGGSTGTYGWIPTKEDRKNIGDGVKKFWDNTSDEYKKEWAEKQSKLNSGKNNPMYGKKRPELLGDNNPAKRPEVRKKISEALKGRLKTDEHKKKLSESMKGKTFEERLGKEKGKEVRLKHKLALQNSTTVGKFEWTEKMREKSRMAKVKYIYEAISPDGKQFIFNSMNKFADERGFNRSGIRQHIKKGTKGYKGWKFKIIGDARKV